MILSIDQGTTGTRAALVDEQGEIARHAYRTHRQIHPRPGWVEHDPEEIWTAVRAVIDEVMHQRDRPDGVALANQGETVVAWDAATGRPVGNAIVWQDTRTLATLDEMGRRDPTLDDLVRSHTGLRLDPYFSAPKIAWLLEHTSEAKPLRAAGRLRVSTLDAWLIARLSGGDCSATDASTAARTLLCDTRACAWSQPLLDRFGVPREVLPEIRDSDGGFGSVRWDGGALEGAPIVASLVDQPAALLGHGCVDAADTKATFGTGCFVFAHTGAHRPEPRHGVLATVAWRTGGAASYALDGGVLSVGSTLGWLTAGLGLLEDARRLDALLEATSHDPALAFVPALVGLGAPHWDRQARGAWLGLSPAAGKADLVLAALEGIACRITEVVRAVEQDGGFSVGALRVDGGLTASSRMMQLQADLLGMPVVVAAEREATVVGAALLAWMRLGKVRLDDVRRRRDAGVRRYEPRSSPAERQARLDRFAQAVDLVRRWR